MKMYKITTKSHWGGIIKTWTVSENRHFTYAEISCNDSGGCLEGYADHRGDCDDEYYPKFNDDGEQISGATVATFEDATAWFGRDVQSIKVEEIGEN